MLLFAALLVQPCAAQPFAFETAKAFQIKVEKNDNICAEVSGDNVRMSPCHDGNNQKFTFKGPQNNEQIRSVEKGASKCLDRRTDSGANLYMGNCHDGNNQKFYPAAWDDHTDIRSGAVLKCRHNNRCVDVNSGDDNLYVHKCHGETNQIFWMECPPDKYPEYANNKEGCLPCTGGSTRRRHRLPALVCTTCNNPGTVGNLHNCITCDGSTRRRSGNGASECKACPAGRIGLSGEDDCVDITTTTTTATTVTATNTTTSTTTSLYKILHVDTQSTLYLKHLNLTAERELQRLRARAEELKQQLQEAQQEEIEQLQPEIENNERQLEALQRDLNARYADSCDEAPDLRLTVAAGNWHIDEQVITIEGFTGQEHGWMFLGHVGEGLQWAHFGGPSFMWRLHALNNSNSTFIVQCLVTDNAGNSYLALDEAQQPKLAPQSNDTDGHWLIEGWE